MAKKDRNKIYTTIGASNHTDKEREGNDYYATEPKAVTLLMPLEDFSDMPVWECACGEGHLAKPMQDAGLEIYATDIIDRGFGGVCDFLSPEIKQWHGHILTNPPFSLAQKFIEKGLDIVGDGHKVAMFLKLQFLESIGRKTLFERTPPRTVYVSRSRIACAKNGDFNGLLKSGGSAVAYAWFIFQKGFIGKPTIEWFN